MKLSIDQIVDLARRHGFADPAFAAAVAMAESGGDASIVRDTRGQVLPPGFGPEYSVGLWQINLLAHPGYTAQQLTDPDVNADAALAISAGGTKWVPGWTTTIQLGRYKPYYHPGAEIVTPPAPRAAPSPSIALAAVGALALATSAGFVVQQRRAERRRQESEPEPFVYP